MYSQRYEQGYLIRKAIASIDSNTSNECSFLLEMCPYETDAGTN